MFTFDTTVDASDLIDGCESFLSGGIAERLLGDGAPVRPWVWTNLLAHGTVDDLATPPRRVAGLPEALEPWVRARAYLAGEILAVVERGSPLLTVQREVLVPIEAEMAARRGEYEITPAEWVGLVVDRLVRRAAERRARGWT